MNPGDDVYSVYTNFCFNPECQMHKRFISDKKLKSLNLKVMGPIGDAWKQGQMPVLHSFAMTRQLCATTVYLPNTVDSLTGMIGFYTLRFFVCSECATDQKYIEQAEDYALTGV